MKSAARISPDSVALFKPVITFGLRLMATILLLGGILTGTAACNGGEMSGVVFDSKKAQPLPQAQRDKYVVELFNQILVRGEPSEMLGDNNPSTVGRYQRFKQMAEEGFEPAYLALKLYNIRRGDSRRNDPEAIRRLLELAESGDATAKCLYAVYYWKSDPSNDLEKKVNGYIREAAHAGVPACMSYFSALEKNNPAAELHWKIEAAIRGDLYAQSNLVWTYSYYKGKGVKEDMAKAACWLIEAKKSGTYYGDGALTTLEQYLRDSRPDVEYCKQIVTGNIR